MRRRKLLAGLITATVVAGVATLALWPRPDPVTLANYDRVEEGMSPAEVTALLGPPGDYRTHETETWADKASSITTP